MAQADDDNDDPMEVDEQPVEEVIEIDDNDEEREERVDDDEPDDPADEDHVDGEEEEEEPSSRRSRRQKAPTKSYRDDVDQDEEDDEDEEEEEYDSRTSRKSSSRSAAFGGGGRSTRSAPSDLESEESDSGKRRSGRSTKFKSSMKEAPDSVNDLLQPETISKRPTKKSSTVEKNAAKASPVKKRGRHAKGRKSILEEVESDDDYDEDEDDDDHMDVADGYDEEEQDDTMKIQRILACRSESLKKWREIGSGMNTSEVTSGSRWTENSELPDGEDTDLIEERFLVKWNTLSYLHVSWETRADLLDQVDNAKTYISTFFRKAENGILFSQDDRKDGDYFDPDFVEVDRILEIWLPEDSKYKKNKLPKTWEEEEAIDPKVEFGVFLDKSDGIRYEEGKGRQFLVKWASQGYAEATYEFEQDLLQKDDFRDKLKEYYRRAKKPSRADIKNRLKKADEAMRRAYLSFGTNAKLDDEERETRAKEYEAELCKYVFRNGGQLRDYQAHGVTWFLSNFINDRSCILADEMGLGKTLQTAAFINLLVERMHLPGPFLICVPLSTIAHWQREFMGWTGLNAIVYHGTADDRDRIRKYEFAYEEDRPESVGSNALYLRKCKGYKNDGPWMATVVITTPEMLVAEGWNELASVKWEVLVVDEAHRLKNHTSKLAVNLRRDEFTFKHKILLTGTPIQNDVKEFWTLLNFIDPDSYDDLEEFLETYGDIKSKETIDQLHEMIRPYILRRLKEDVEKSVPPKEETLIEVELTVLQKQYYKALYEKNVGFLHKPGRKALDGPSLNNLAMQLRKCCNHLFLINGVEDDLRLKKKDTMDEADFMTQGSGKFVLLEKLLPRLKQDGHRVLIFSQFKILLDVLMDYLHEREYRFERIDGSITGHKRQAAIDRFQDAQSKDPPFIMLLSTRAGGVGINLTAADTCIIFDSDWNPQNDIQAMARCHRIGQKKSVKIFRLLSRKTYEMQMFHLSSMKMGLDQAVLTGFEKSNTADNTNMTKEEVEKLLRHGAYDIFAEDKAGTGEAESKDFIEQDIDSILARRTRQIVHENTGSGSAAAGGTFSKASFVNSKTPTKGKDATQSNADEVDINDPDFWTKMVGEAKPEEESFLQEKRKRKETNYNEKTWHKLQHLGLGDDDSASGTSDGDSDDSAEDPDEKERARWGGHKPGNWKRVHAEYVLELMERFGYGIKSWEEFEEDLPKEARNRTRTELHRMAWSMVLSSLCEVANNDGKASARRLRSKRENEGEPLADSATESKTEEAMINNAFRKLLKQHGFWINKAFTDAVAFAKVNLPRILHSDHNDTIRTMFQNNLWSPLQARGWTEDEDEDDVYIYESKTYSSPSEVMNEAIRIHPELAEMIQQTLTKLEEARLHSDQINKQQRDKDLAMSISSVDLKSLEDFLDKYAPMQLVTERRRTNNRMAMGKRLLTYCQYMKAASDVVKAAETTGDPRSSDDRLMRHIAVDDRTGLPCVGWTPKHDALLVRAITKHGWLDVERSLKNIVTDKSIHWDAPFELTKKAPIKAMVEDEIQGLRNVAQRAAAILNESEKILSAVKGFNKEQLVETYGLVRHAPESDHPDQLVWKVDDSRLGEAFKKSDAEAEEPMDLPASKSLRARAKKLMIRPLEVLIAGGVFMSASAGMNSSADGEDVTTVDHNYEIIDQKNLCNVLLVQLLRFIIHSTPSKHVVACRNAFDLAEKEIALNLKSSSHDLKWKKISDQVTTARREITKTTIVTTGKNVLRIMVGEQPKQPKIGPMFPQELDEKENIGTGSSIRGKKRVVKKSSGEKADGEKAVARAMKKAIDTNGGNNTFSNSQNKDDLGMQLTYAEAWILLVMCFEGVPLAPLKSGKIDSLTTPKTWKEIGDSWFAIATEQQHVAASIVAQCKALIEKAKAKNASQDQLAKLAENLSKAERDLRVREDAKNVAKELHEAPNSLAKKGIMLVEKVRRYGFGPSTSKGPAATHKYENYLGPKIPVWFKNELDKTLSSEGLKEDGTALLYITADVAKNDPKLNNTAIAAFLDKKSARQVTSQIALMSRLRAMLLVNNESDFRAKLKQAADVSAKLKEEWERKPSWWDDSSEEQPFLMLTRLDAYGFVKVMTTPEAAEGFGDPDEDLSEVGSLKDLGLTKAVIQQRANQLVRELHQIEDSEKVFRRFDRKSLDSLASAPWPASSSVSLSANKKATKQTDMTSFFQAKPSAKKKRLSTVVSSIETADNDLRRGWKNVNGSSSSSSPDSLASVGKRKEPDDVIVLDDSGSTGAAETPPEKKAKSGVTY